MPPLALIISSNPNRSEKIRAELAAVGWRATVGRSPQEALRQLQESEVAAVFCDGVLRGASPAGFLAWTRRTRPRARFHLIGDPASWRGKLRPDGFLSWPLIRNELPVAPGTVIPTETELDADDVPLSGTTALMSLPQLLDMLSFSGRDATVQLHGGRGFVHLQNKVVLHASHQQTGTMLSGMPALASLVALPDTDFSVLEFSPPSRNTINLSVAGAVSEAARLVDERERDEALIRELLRHQPRLSAVAVGYRLAQQPDAGHGTSAQLFSRAVALLESQRAALGLVPQSLCVSTERHSLAIHAVTDTRFVAISVDAKVGAALLRLLEKCLQQVSEPASVP